MDARMYGIYFMLLGISGTINAFARQFPASTEVDDYSHLYPLLGVHDYYEFLYFLDKQALSKAIERDNFDSKRPTSDFLDGSSPAPDENTSTAVVDGNFPLNDKTDEVTESESLATGITMPLKVSTDSYPTTSNPIEVSTQYPNLESSYKGEELHSTSREPNTDSSTSSSTIEDNITTARELTDGTTTTDSRSGSTDSNIFSSTIEEKITTKREMTDGTTKTDSRSGSTESGSPKSITDSNIFSSNIEEKITTERELADGTSTTDSRSGSTESGSPKSITDSNIFSPTSEEKIITETELTDGTTTTDSKLGSTESGHLKSEQVPIAEDHVIRISSIRTARMIVSVIFIAIALVAASVLAIYMFTVRRRRIEYDQLLLLR